jgi:hypothetical protein
VRFLSGDSLGDGASFTVGADGTITEGDAIPVEDDPGTPIDEGKAAKYGGVVRVGVAINDFFALVDGYYDASVPLATTQYTINTLFPTPNDANMDNAIANYYSYRDVPNSGIVTLGYALFFGHLYCEGYSYQELAAWVYNMAISFEKKQIVIELLNAIGESWYTENYQKGTLAPSSDYQSAACEPIETEEFILDFSISNTPGFAFSGIWKPFHRMRLDLSGSFVDTDVPNVVRDAFYKFDTSTGVATFENFNIVVSGIDAKTSLQVPYQPSHVYSVTYDKDGAFDGGYFNKDNGDFALPNVTGIINLAIVDEGEYK